MESVTDTEWEKAISKIIHQLLGDEAASKIVFKPKESGAGLGVFGADIDSKRCIILINIKTKKMLEDEQGRDIVYAVLAHEIGHIIHMEDTDFYYEDTPEFFFKSEIEADKRALILLAKVYENSKEILLKQIDYAVNAVISCDYATAEDREKTTELGKKRRKAVMSS